MSQSPCAESESEGRFPLVAIKLPPSSPPSSSPPPPPLPASCSPHHLSEHVWVVARCSLIACLASFVGGMTLGFSSPALLELSNENLTVPAQRFDASSISSSIFGSMSVIGAAVGSPLAWPVASYFGRQKALKLGGIPALCGWLLISNSVRITGSTNAFLMALLLGRLLTGLSHGWSVAIVSVYIAEISSPKLKGFFGNFNQLFLTLGIATSYFLSIRFGDFQMRYSDIALVGAGVVVLFEVLMMVATVESPRWLFSKNREDSGTQALKLLRGGNSDVGEEVNEIKAGLEQKCSVKDQLLAFKHRSVYHPFILVIFIMFFRQFGGMIAVWAYASQIFSEAGYSVEKANLVSFGAVGCVQVLAVLISVALVDCLGRRTLLIASSIGMILSSLLLGIYFFVFDVACEDSLESPQCPQGIEFLAITSIVIFICSQSLGWGPISFSSIGELLPGQVRTLGGSAAIFAMGSFGAIVIFVFPPYADLVGPSFTWWTFGIIMIASIVFVVLFLPEAKGKSLEEIQDLFKKRRIFFCSCPDSAVCVRTQ